MVADWLAYPLLLAALCAGCGAAAAGLSGRRVPAALILPLGFAVVIVVAQLVVLWPAAAHLAPWAVVALAVAGGAPLARRVRSLGDVRVDVWLAAAVAAAFACYAAPVVLSGQATFLGFVRLDDTSSFLAFTDQVLARGRDISGLAPSTYERVLDVNIAHGYPIGSVLPLGIGSRLTGIDPAWLYQPYLAFCAALLVPALYVVAAPIVRRRPLRALVAAVAAQPALLYGYAAWGGIKELATAPLIALAAALLLPLLEPRARARDAIPLAFAAAALAGVDSVAGLVWLLPALLAVPFAVRRHGRAAALRLSAATVAAWAVLAIPSLLAAGQFLRSANMDALGSATELGTLIRPLGFVQVVGIWPSGDFRTATVSSAATVALVVVACVAATMGAALAVRRRAWPLFLFVLGTLAACALLVLVESPWIGGKALAVAAPAVLLTALVGAGGFLRGGALPVAALGGAAIVLGVGWSNVLAYHAVNLAPRPALAELQSIGERFAGDGPTLMTEYNVYGARHFLRSMDPESASELRVRTIPLRSGSFLAKGQTADLDAFQLSAILVYRTIVLRRSPLESRPPAPYRLVWQGRTFEVWQRGVGVGGEVLEHAPLGRRDPAAPAPCSTVERLAKLPGAVRLAAVPRLPVTIVRLGRLGHPASWLPDHLDTEVLWPNAPGLVAAEVRVPAAGRYSIWVGESFRDGLEVLVDGREVGRAQGAIAWYLAITQVGSVRLAAGVHRVVLRTNGPSWRPGTAGAAIPLGPLVLARQTADAPVVTVPVARAKELCGRRLDWVEAMRA